MLKTGARTLVITSAFMPSLASLAVALRVYLRMANKKARVGTSEYLILACLVSV